MCWTENTIITAGDFNMNILNQLNANTQKLCEVVNSCGLKHTIHIPTRNTLISKSCIDNIITNGNYCFADIIATDFADHDMAQKAVKREYDNLLRDNKLQKFKQKLTDSDNKSKAPWSAVREIKGITGKTMQTPGDLIKTAEDFGTCFQTLVTNNLHQSIINTTSPTSP
ncbi:hypothetical protein WA026_022201 [Henosepilachna vigintioctopunctata]|uniref:Endonuclease/exonuclease/phosphatase domain-containing protein n=1 Tax=Henosepilachna vigintioctopunctata TaxID=420089 RepID=A0AAW1UPW3_9CUCU